MYKINRLFYARMLAISHRTLSSLLKWKCQALRHDNNLQIESIKSSTNKAAVSGNVSATFKIVRGLAGVKSAPRSLSGIKDKDGNILTDKLAIADRWQQYHAATLSATVVDNVSTMCTGPDFTDTASTLSFSVLDVLNAINQLSASKAPGPDGIHAGVLQAGGLVVGHQLWTLINMILKSGNVPWKWRGGRIVSRWKGKGDQQVCENHRGLLISDHASKVLASLVHTNLNEKYTRFVGPFRFGATAKRGADLAHVLRFALLGVCHSSGWSGAVFYLDLARAVDAAIREVVVGPMGNPEDAMRTLFTKLGLSFVDANDLSNYIT